MQKTKRSSNETFQLAKNQIVSFKQEGYLVLRDFLDTSLLETWREQFWAHADGKLEDKNSWPTEKNIGDLKLTPELGSLPTIKSIVGQLGGEQFNGGGCGILTRWPQEKHEWQMPTTGHLDGYPGEGCQAVLMIGATTYLYDVDSGGGAFVYWPCSHQDAHRYFLEFPDQIEGTFRETPEWKEHNWGIFQRHSTTPPQEFTGKAGDIILWHGWLSHSGSANIQEVPRIGLFSRWTHKNDTGIRKKLPQDLWDYWII